MISIIDIFKLVMRYAFEKKGRVILTISGIIIGIFTFTFFIFLSQGLSNAITEQFTTFGVNIIGIQPASASFASGPPGGGGLTDTDLARVKQVIKDYKYVAPGIFYTGQYEYSRLKHSFTSLAYPDDKWGQINLDIGAIPNEGRFLKQGDSGVAVIGAKVVDAFGQGKELTVGSVIKANGQSLRIIGILKSKGDLMIDNAILIPWDDMKAISNQNTYTMIRASFYENVDISHTRRNTSSMGYDTYLYEHFNKVIITKDKVFRTSMKNSKHYLSPVETRKKYTEFFVKKLAEKLQKKRNVLLNHSKDTKNQIIKNKCQSVF